MKIVFLGFLPFGDGGDVGDVGDGDADGGGGDGGDDGGDGGVDSGDDGDNGDGGRLAGGIYPRPHLCKFHSDLLEYRINVEDILKDPHRNTMQEGSKFDN